MFGRWRGLPGIAQLRCQHAMFTRVRILSLMRWNACSRPSKIHRGPCFQQRPGSGPEKCSGECSEYLFRWAWIRMCGRTTHTLFPKTCNHVQIEPRAQFFPYKQEVGGSSPSPPTNNPCKSHVCENHDRVSVLNRTPIVPVEKAGFGRFPRCTPVVHPAALGPARSFYESGK